MIDFSVRQISFLTSDDYNPAKLQAIAQHFQIGNSRACLFCLSYIYDLDGYQGPKWTAGEPKQVKSVFLPFLPHQLTKAEGMAKGLGINLGELCKRAIYETSKQLENGKLERSSPKVIRFFKLMDDSIDKTPQTKLVFNRNEEIEKKPQTKVISKKRSLKLSPKDWKIIDSFE